MPMALRNRNERGGAVNDAPTLRPSPRRRARAAQLTCTLSWNSASGSHCSRTLQRRRSDSDEKKWTRSGRGFCNGIQRIPQLLRTFAGASGFLGRCRLLWHRV